MLKKVNVPTLAENARRMGHPWMFGYRALTG
jgi:hypothetical protein